LTAARNKVRVIAGRDRGEVERLERERSVNPLITINGARSTGTVFSRKVGPGQYVPQRCGRFALRIADLTTMWLKANVPENDIASVQVGQEIEVRVTACRTRSTKARISASRGLGLGDPARRRALGAPNPDAG